VAYSAHTAPNFKSISPEHLSCAIQNGDSEDHYFKRSYLL
jgi:hypothetical protein